MGIGPVGRVPLRTPSGLLAAGTSGLGCAGRAAAAKMEPLPCWGGFVFIEVDYRLEPEENARGSLAAFRRGLWINVALLAAFVLLLAVMFTAPLVFSGATRPPLTTTLVGVVCCLYLANQVFLRKARFLRRCRKLGARSVSAVFTESGATLRVRAQSGEHRSDVTWSRWIRIRETPDFFFLYTTRKSVLIVPKSAFDAEQAAMFSRFVRDGFAQARLAAAESVAPPR